MEKRKRLSEHFTLEELSYSGTGVENGIDNTPGEEAYGRLEHLVSSLLEPLRRVYGKPIAVTSGYRCEEINRLVGGVAGSQHTRGEAADCYVTDAGELLAVLRRSGLEFDQAIHYRKRNFLHLSLKRCGTNRMQVLLRFLVLAFLLQGCGFSRQSHLAETTERMDSVLIALRETSLQNRNIRLTDTTAWDVHRVVYFAPDSLGKQYPQAVTTLQMKHRRQFADTGKVAMQKQADYAERRTEVAVVRKESDRTARSPGYFFCWLLLLLVLSVFLYRRLRSG